MKIWTCGSSPHSGSGNTWTRLRNFNGSVVWATFGIWNGHRFVYTNPYLLYFFLVRLLLPTYRRCRCWLSHMIQLNDTHTRTCTRYDSPGQGIGPSQKPLTCATHSIHNGQIAEFELASPASERPRTYALDSAATGIGACVPLFARTQMLITSFTQILVFVALFT